MAAGTEAERVARAVVATFGDADLEGLRALLADEFVAHLTTADGGRRDVGPEDYVAGVAAMDVGSANLRLDIPDVTATGPESVLVMVEVHAERRGRRLHNHSGQLLTVRDGRVVELWMVDALPEESDEFWSA